MRVVLFVLSCFLLLPSWASNPGEPLDCTDWVSVEPSYACLEWRPDANVDPPASPWINWPPNERAADNEGRILRVEKTGSRTEVQWFDGQQTGLVGYWEDRSNVDQTVDVIKPETPYSVADTVKFDDTNGRLFVPLQSDPPRNHWIAAIVRFTTTFEILQTYTPTADLGFRVPAMPEGFQFADWFDTYYGDLATVGDWSQAQSLQCGYPSTAPSVGDYLTVADPLPDPAPGHGRYYVTAVNYQGETRYGRKKPPGQPLSGRDPAVLPTCQ